MGRSLGKAPKTMTGRKLVVRPVAELEANQAYDWYEEQEEGLGDRMRHSIKRAIDSIVARPLTFPVVFGSNVRHAVIQDFPYRIVFSTNNESIVIFAIFHTSRTPMIWRGRIG